MNISFIGVDAVASQFNRLKDGKTKLTPKYKSSKGNCML